MQLIRAHKFYGYLLMDYSSIANFGGSTVPIAAHCPHTNQY